MTSKIITIQKTIARLLDYRKYATLSKLSFPKNIKLFEPKQKERKTQDRKYASINTHCDAHMNELPIPCGPFDILYKDTQAFYNKVLILGILWWIFSLAMVIWTESIYLNWAPPAQPGPPSDMVEECDDSEN